MIVVDTNVLIDWHRYAHDPAEQYGASILSRAELEFGINAAPDPTTAAARRSHLNALDARIDWLPFDTAASRSYGVLAAAVRAAGAPAQTRRTDTYIAAQAHALGAALMTENTDDFAHLARLLQILRPASPD